MDADRVLFFTGGIATLTLMVNATTCPMLVRFLGITRTPAAKANIISSILDQLTQVAHSKAHSEAVTDIVNDMVVEVQLHVADAIRASNQVPGGHALAKLRASKGETDDLSKNQTARSSVESLRRFVAKEQPDIKGYDDILADYEHARSDLAKMADEVGFLFELSSVLAALNADDTSLRQSLMGSDTNVEEDGRMARAVNEAFLSLIRTQYWHMNETGQFVSGTNHAELLLQSVAWGIERADRELADFQFLQQELDFLHKDYERFLNNALSVQTHTTNFSSWVSDGHVSPKSTSVRAVSQMSSKFLEAQENARSQFQNTSVHSPSSSQAWQETQMINRQRTEELWREEKAYGRKPAFIDSDAFQVCITVIILLNAIFIAFEEHYRDDQQEDVLYFVFLEVFFILCFSVEFVMKIVVQRLHYFSSFWNIFDFVLLLLGLTSLLLEFLLVELQDNLKSESVADSNNARLVRLSRIFRVLRIIRLVRLFRFTQMVYKIFSSTSVSLELAEHLQPIVILTAFAKAHTSAQKELERFLGNQDKMCKEAARCILESRTKVSEAVVCAVREAMLVESHIFESMHLVRESSNVANDLHHFVEEAHTSGLLSGNEANYFLVPLRSCKYIFNKYLKETEHGNLSSQYTYRAMIRNIFHRAAESKRTSTAQRRNSMATPANYRRTISTVSMRSSVSSQCNGSGRNPSLSGPENKVSQYSPKSSSYSMDIMDSDIADVDQAGPEPEKTEAFVQMPNGNGEDSHTKLRSTATGEDGAQGLTLQDLDGHSEDGR
eukprot:gnl/TRDRNA2_/TRDRNA2_144761_c0_seq1.p1 gnl/TRDRNA2_/TRDRNA2_144761_c0~~gnl/TRDRNA2_/TRDRNA2_144761_c0_seq1.p1  ORF type:complete len:862 (+),score=127.29 gnl/TRDRNA2_/TRDRNA2_144761_c0_seq1:247-2586(+)